MACFTQGVELRRERVRQTLFGPRMLEVASSPLRDSDGNIVGGIETVRDVTERRLHEEELRRLNDDLKAFGYALSHDIRGPLTKIQIASEHLQEPDLADHDTQMECLKILQSGVTEINSLVDAMLLLSQVGNAAMSMEKVDISVLADDVFTGLLLLEPHRRVQCQIEKNMTAHGDESLLRILLTNILQNALKYTSGREVAEITVGSVVRGGRTWFFVRDNGIGFQEEYSGRLFKPFERLPNSRGMKGHGIGLATSARVVERHKGVIRAEGSPDGGATIYFFIPRSPSPDL